MKRVIQKWESSGQGDGGLYDCHNKEGSVSDDEGTGADIQFGELENCSRMVLCNRASFIRINESYLLY